MQIHFPILERGQVSVYFCARILHGSGDGK